MPPAPMPEHPPTPTPGRIVRFTDDHGDVWPAIIVSVQGGELVDLNVFTQIGVVPELAVLRGRRGEPDTWHWPER